jgi:hypothetical protein
MRQPKIGDRVEVRWFDITSFPGWHHNDDWDLMECASMGYVVRVRKSDIAIAQDMGDINEDAREASLCGSVTIIPKVNIRSIKILRGVRR